MKNISNKFSKVLSLLLIFLLTFSFAPLNTEASAGDFVWAKSMSGTGADIAFSIFIDSSGNVYTTGRFAGTVDFDPGAGTSNLTSVGGTDIFISKLDSSGNFVWAKSVGSTSSDVANSISIDSSSNIYTTGRFRNTVDFDPGAGVLNLTSAGGDDIFISKLDSNGDFLWAKSMGGRTNDRGSSIATDSSGNVYTTGRFTGTVDFDPGAGTSNLTSVGSDDIFLSKLNSSGDFVWAKSVGSTSSDVANSISIDSSGNVYTTGYIYDTADFDPGVGIFNLTPVGDADIFISKLDSSGNFVWAKSMGGTANDQGLSTSIDSSGNIYTTGYFAGTVDFDPGAGTSNLTSASGSNDIFILKLGDTAPTLTEVTAVGVVVNNNPINYTFSTDQAGTITYGGSCSSATTNATLGNNTITFNALSAGTYSNCTITVTDATSNISTPLTISPFSIVVHSGGGSSTPSTPVITTPTIPTITTPVPTTPITPVTPVIPEVTPLQANNNQCPSNLILTQNLKAGARDNKYHSYTKAIVKEVKILQTHMNRLGFNSGKVDGILGPITDGAIKRMQAYLGTTQDGFVGPITRDLINKSCN